MSNPPTYYRFTQLEECLEQVINDKDEFYHVECITKKKLCIECCKYSDFLFLNILDLLYKKRKKFNWNTLKFDTVLCLSRKISYHFIEKYIHMIWNTEAVVNSDHIPLRIKQLVYDTKICR